MGYYAYIYEPYIDRLPESDLDLLRQAEGQLWEDIYPSRATSVLGERLLFEMEKDKFHRQDEEYEL